jgi:NitT/TauT family transport system substrate-binding protein
MECSRRLMLKALSLATLPAASLLNAGCAQDGVLRIGAHVWPGYEFMFLAKDEGWLDDKRLALIETGSATGSLEALAADTIDGAALTLDEVIRARANGLPLTIVLVFNVSAGADALVAKAELTHLAELKNKRVGVEVGALGALMLAHVLARAGLQRGDVQEISIAADSHLNAWTAGEVDALITYQPTLTALEERGARMLFDSRDIPDTIFDVLAVRSDRLEKHGPALRNLIAGHFRGLNALKRNPQDTAFRLARRLGLLGQEVMRAYRGLSLPGPDANHGYLGREGSRLFAAAQATQALMLEWDILDKTAPLDELLDANYLPSSSIR